MLFPYRQDNEIVVLPPTKMVTVPTRFYCVVENPVLRDEDNNVIREPHSEQVKLRHSEKEVRLAQPPFPLYPGEILRVDVTRLTVVEPDSALHLKAILDFTDSSGVKRAAGCEWLFGKLNHLSP